MRLLTCTALLALAPLAASADIVVGQSAPLTGGNAELGNDIRNGALAYFNKVNAAGGLPQGKIKLVTLDDRNDTKLSGENTGKLLGEGAVALFGYASSTLSIPAMPAVLEAKVPFFAPFTGADAIRKQNDYVYTVRATYADEIEKIVNFWGNLGSTRVTVLHYDDAVGKQNFETVAAVLKKFNRTPVSVAIKRNAEVSDADVKAVAASEPNVLVVTTLYAPAAQMIKKLKAAGKGGSMVTSLSFAGASQLAKALGQDATGVSVALTVPAPRAQAVPVVKECSDAWTAAGMKDAMSVTALESCIAAKVLVEGMKRAGKDLTRASLHKSLSALGRYDTGGYVVDFKPNFRHGGSYVSIALLRPNGEVRD